MPLRNDAALIARALRAAPIGLAAQDIDLRYTWAPQGAHPLGARDGDVVGCTEEELYPAGTAARLRALKRRVLETGRGVHTEIAVGREDDARHFDLTLEPITATEGEAPIGVSTIAFDITTHKRLEREAELARDRLAEAEHLAQLGSWEWDIEANRVVWSDGLFAIYGISRSGFSGRYSPSSERVHPDDRECVDAAVAHALATCEPIDEEYRIVRPDGRVRRVRGRAEVITDRVGRPLRMTGTVQDVTDRRPPVEESRNNGSLRRQLTGRQLEILELVGQGLSNAEIADRLVLGESTVKWHVRQILRALQVANRAQAVAHYHAAERRSAH